jgi:pyruvate dehydrogenase E1 component
MLERRRQLKGFVPTRIAQSEPLKLESLPEAFAEFAKGSEGRKASTTMVFVRMLARMLKDKEIGELVVPIVPDEARTFGMEALFRQVGIYSHVGQLYEPVDMDTLLYYKEAKEGQILEEGITEAGSISSFIAAGTAYATHGINTIPFFIYYSMFGMQRVGDLVWAAADNRTRGFLLGGTAGRTTLAGEGLQHQDGHSHLLSLAVPTLISYDPAYAYEIAVIIEEGIRRMYKNGESVFYYLTLMNENYTMPPMPPNAEEGIREGMYRFRQAPQKGKHRAHLLAGGPLVNEALRAQELLLERYGVAADVWSVTSFKTLAVRTLEAERWNMWHPDEPPRVSYLQKTVKQLDAPCVAVSDYVRLVSQQIAPWIPGLLALGTDGFGRSDTRQALRRFFEIDAEHLVVATLYALHKQHGTVEAQAVRQAAQDLGVRADDQAPWQR